jgi:hypothetical protein
MVQGKGVTGKKISFATSDEAEGERLMDESY